MTVTSSEAAHTLERLRKENEAQEGVLRALKTELQPRSFSTSGSLRVAPGSSISYFHIAVERKWNYEFQALCSAAISNATSGEANNNTNTTVKNNTIHTSMASVTEKIAAINAFLKAFEDAMVPLAQTFLDQYLGETDAELVFESDPITTGFGVTIALLDCEDRSHISIAAKEQAAQYRLLAQQVAFMREPLIAVAPKVIVSFKGRLMVVSAEAAHVSEPYSSEECFELRLVMDLAAETLGFRRYNYGGAGGEEQKGSGPLKAAAIKADDGRLYAHTVQGLYPYFPPAKGTIVDAAVHKVHLRPELVSLSALARPLSTSAFVAFGSSDSSECNTDVRDAAAYMCQVLVPNTVTAWLASPPTTHSGLIEAIHSSGINVACLGVLYHAAAVAAARKDPHRATAVATMLWTEMCARALRDVIQQSMSHKIEGTEVLESVGEVLSELGADVSGFCTETLLPILKKKFIGLATLTTETSFPLQSAHLNTSMLVTRTTELIGVTLSPIGSTLSTDPSAYSVTAMNPIVKRLRLPQPLLHKKTLGDDGRSDGSFAGLEHRANVYCHASADAAGRYLKSREDQLVAKAFFTELANAQHGSSYIYACFDMAAMLNDTLEEVSRNALATPSVKKGLRAYTATASTKTPEALSLASEVVAVATVGLTSITESPHTGGSPGVVVIRALLKLERAVARAALIPANRQHLHDAFADAQLAFKLLAPNVRLHGEKEPLVTARHGAPSEHPNSSVGTPRIPAGTQQTATADKPPKNFSVYALEAAVYFASLANARDVVEEAYPPLQYAFEASHALYGGSDSRTAAVTALLAANCLARNDVDAAETHLRGAIAAITAFNKDSIELSYLLTSLADIVDRRQQTSGSVGANSLSSAMGATESDTLHQRNIGIVIAANGPNHPYLAVTHNNYAASLIRRNKLADADTQLSSAIAILRRVHGTKPAVEVAETLNNIANVRRHQKRMEEAKASWLEALSTYEAVLPLSTNDQKLIPVLENLSAWCREMNNHTERDSFEKRIAAIKRANGV